MKWLPDPGEGILVDFTLGPRENMGIKKYLKKERGRQEKEESRVQMCILACKTVLYIKACRTIF
jgi:hypothetical protein